MQKVDRLLQQGASENAKWEQLAEQQMERLLSYPAVKQFCAENTAITSDVIMRSISKINEFVSEDQAYQTTGSSLIVPGYRPVLVWSGDMIDVSYIKTTQTLQKEAVESQKNRVRFVSVPKSVRKARFSDVYIRPENGNVIAAVDAFIERYQTQSDEFTKGLYIWGPFGVGKTYLMGAMVNRLAEYGLSSTFVNTAMFVSELKQSFGKANDDIQKRIDTLKTVPLLILDDIGAEAMSDWVRDDVIGVILQYRMQEELPTFFTSNLSLQQLEEHLADTKTKVDHLKAKRIMERIHFLADEVMMAGENMRY